MAAEAGEDCAEIEIQDPAFKDVASTPDDRLRLSPPWPADNLPPVTASLLSIASQKGLLAAAGPDSLSIVNTEKVRVRYLVRRSERKALPLEPDVKLSIPRVSHVAFSSDESCLVIAAEQGGGLAVYDTDALSNAAQPAFQIATNGTSIRHLLPNPGKDFAHLFGIVLADGKLLLADLKARSLVNSSSGGPVFHERVSSAAWSNLGKQIIAGLEDSSAAQIDPLGNVKDRIPLPPQLQDIRQADYPSAQGLPITSVLWLSTHEFVLIYSPTYAANISEDELPMLDSVYFYATRRKGEPFAFHRFQADPSTPFGMLSRTPSYHFTARLSDWQNIAEMLIITSTASDTVGLLAKFKDDVNNRFSTATIAESRNGRAAMPTAEDGDGETSPVGMAIDFSTKEAAPQPIPNEEDVYPHSTIALPALYLLNTDGVLCMWWVVYSAAIKQRAVYPGMVHKNGKYSKYKKYNRVKVDLDVDSENPHQATEQESDDETEPLNGAVSVTTRSASLFGAAPAAASQPKAAPVTSTLFGSGSSSQGQSSPFGASSFSKPAISTPAFGQTSSPGFGTTGGLGQKPSPWGAQNGATSSSTPAPPAFQSSPFGQASKPGTVSAFGQTSKVGSSSTFGQPSQTGAFGQTSQPGSAFGQLGLMGKTNSSLFGGNTSTDSPFAKFAKGSAFGTVSSQTSASPFASTNQTLPASPFASEKTNQSPIAQKPALSKENTSASTATIGSSTFSSFGQASAFGGGSSFASRPAVSKESTFNEKQSGSTPQEGGLPASSGFQLGSIFKGDGTAKDDLPKPANAGAGMFGAGFGDALGTVPTKPEPPIKQETEEEPSMKDIPSFKPDEAPLPPDPSTYKAPKMPDISSLPGFGGPASKKAADTNDAPLPPDPTTYKAPKMPDVSEILGTRSTETKKQEDKNVPIAGSPPLNVTHSQTFSEEGSEAVLPSDEEEGSWEDQDDAANEQDEEEDEEEEDEGEEDEEGDEDDDNEDDSDDDGEDFDEDEYPKPEDSAALSAFKARMQPPSPKGPEQRTQARTPHSYQKIDKSSYTPAGLPKGPVFAPPTRLNEHSPRSPSPQRRAVTSPVRNPLSLPSQIKTSAVPPLKPVETYTAPKKPTEPTAGELEDEAMTRVEALLNAAIEPTLELPTFYSHTDYAGSVDNSGLGGQVEKVFRDANSMIHVVGLNVRSLLSFLTGQQDLRKSGKRTSADFEDPGTWCLGDMQDLYQVMEVARKQLEDGKLDRVRERLSDLAEDAREVRTIQNRTTDLRKHITAQTDPQRHAMRQAAPLSAEVQAQQTELRQGVQRVQKLLSEVEQKMTMLRADLSSLSKDTSQTPAPTVEAVMNTIIKMTAMVEQKSGDVDVLESQIRRLPHGMASLHMPNDYEDDISSRLASHRLLAGSPVTTPQRRPRMAANGDALGMSAMFGASRFQTPPSGRASKSFTPEMSGLGRSTGSLGGSARKKMSAVTEEEIDVFHAKVQRRRNVLGALKGKVEGRPIRVTKVDA